MRMRRLLAAASLSAALTLVAQPPVGASVLRVPNNIGSIGLALLLASPNDTILVAPGTYHVNLQWPDKQGLKLLSEAGAEQTILDGSGDVQVIGVYTGVDTTTVISGFTIRNGHAEGQ